MTDPFKVWWEEFKNFDDSLGHKEAFARRVWDEAMQAKSDEIERLRAMLTGWSGHAWKSGVYVDDIQEFFDGGEIVARIHTRDKNPRPAAKDRPC